MVSDPYSLRIDLRETSYEDWLAFIFAHPVAAEGEQEWYHLTDLDVAFDPVRQVGFLGKLLWGPDVLLERFSPGQIEQGFWFMFGGVGDWWFRTLLWDPAVSWEARHECILALPRLYADLFERCKLDTIPFMLPDLLADGYGYELRHPTSDPEDRRVQEALFVAFRRMLTSDHKDTQAAALHGLHHLAHPLGPKAIRAYLRSRPRPSPELRRYADLVLAGKAM